MTLQQLTAVIKKQLSDFNIRDVEITNDTVINDVLSHNFNNAQRLFQGNVRWTVHNQTGRDKRFPTGWLNLTASELAGRLLTVLAFLFITLTSQAQLNVNVSGIKTDLKEPALNLAFSYIQSLDSLFGGQELMVYSKKSYLAITPDVDFQTGTSDGFSSIALKASGLWTHFRTTTVEGIETPDASKTLHVFPISVGVETNKRFDFVNSLLEVGYQPYYQGSHNLWDRTTFGVYLQAGYKFRLDSTGGKGGDIDQSKEAVDSRLLRAKGTFLIDTRGIIHVGTWSVGLVGSSDVWRDLINRVWYYKVEGTMRVYLTPTVYLDVSYQKGSGAPLFNEGQQFGGGLTLRF
jgi:hypothetical protein